MERLYDRLSAYQASDYYGFHMPGHKRQASWGDNLPFGIDITEIEGFDDLHHASADSQSVRRGRKPFSGEWKYSRNPECDTWLHEEG